LKQEIENKSIGLTGILYISIITWPLCSYKW